MARTRKVESSEILDAALRVVTRLGAVGLSLDAVAQEAGISKSRVVYDYKSKSALVEALIDRQMNEDNELLRTLVKDCAHTPHPEFFGRCKMAEMEPNDVDKAVAMTISASVSSEENIHAKMQKCISADFDAMQSGAKPRAALMGHLALVGMCCHEWFGFRTWTEQERIQMVADVKKLYASFPEETGK